MLFFRTFNHFAPPGEANQRQGWLGGYLAGPGKLVVEGIEQEQKFTLLLWGKQGTKKPVRVGAANMEKKRA
jgi:hypothetical protein